MTQTLQARSWISINEAGKSLTISKPPQEDTVSLLLDVFDSLNDLCEKLNRLNNMLHRKEMECIFRRYL
jgi:hypothetical protein